MKSRVTAIIRHFGSYGTGRGAASRRVQRHGKCVIEDGARLFGPEHINLGSNVYIGHDTMINAYGKGMVMIGDDTWVGPQCFLHGAGGITIGARVGIGAGVRILTSWHDLDDQPAILFSRTDFAPVHIGDDTDLGVGSILLPGVTIGRGAQIGAGSVVTKNVPAFAVVAGNPARRLRRRRVR